MCPLAAPPALPWEQEVESEPESVVQVRLLCGKVGSPAP